MASGLFILLDDIAMLMDDTAAMTKIAAKKTAGILGDDLAVGAEKASGHSVSRELPVIWAIAKGSFLNKLIILPLAFILSWLAPWLIIPILVGGGLYLSFEAVEKINEMIFKHEVFKEKGSEKSKIKSAILTDFILSIEIIVITLGTVVSEPLINQIIIVSLIAIGATVLVYGLVAILVRLDDIGFYLKIKNNDKGLLSKIGDGLIWSLPKIIVSLGYIGTLAMLLVGGGIFIHNISFFHDFNLFDIPLSGEIILSLVFGYIVLNLTKLYDKIIK